MYRVGIDVGGTGIKVGILNEAHQLVTEGSIPTVISDAFESQVARIVQCIRETASGAGIGEHEIESVGVGIPGIANDEGVVIKCTNMGWNHVPFSATFRRLWDVPVRIDNDANVAALAESVSGVSAGTSSSVFITVGTGIGSGIIINGKIWKGFHGIGGELGHVILKLDGEPCSCGNRGCLERYCSATALIRMGREAVHGHPESGILASVSGDASRIEARTVIDNARTGDPIAVEVYGRFISYLSQAIASVVNLLDPEVIVIGGGVSKAGSFLLDPIREEYKRYVIFNDQPMPEIKLAILGSKAGIIGAAML